MKTTTLLGLFVGLLLLPSPSRASFHLMKVKEIFVGTDDTQQYVVLEMTASGQNFVGGQSITTSNGTFGEFSDDVASGTSGGKILMATKAAADAFGITPDAIATGTLDFPDGSVDFAGVDDVRYGDVEDSEAPALVKGSALKLGDDGEWTLGEPSPVNNAGETGGGGESESESEAEAEAESEAESEAEAEAEAEAEGEDDDDDYEDGDDGGCQIGRGRSAYAGLALSLLGLALFLRRKR